MGISTIQNFYKETITRAVTLTGATNIYVSALPTPSEGYVVISPSSSTLREIVYYTAKGTDGNGNFITVTLANRGLGGTTAQTHVIGEPVRMNVTAEHIKEISDALDQIVAGGAQDASTITKGIVKLNVVPAIATEPIAVGANVLTNISYGTSSAGKVPQLDSNGKIDDSMVNPQTGMIGDGSDGDVTISSPTNLSRDMYYNNLTVNDVLTTNGYRIFVKGTLTGTGTIQYPNGNNGGNGSYSTGGSAGTAYTAGGYLQNTAGVAGGDGAAGNGRGGSAGRAGINGHFGTAPVGGGKGGEGEDNDGRYGGGAGGVGGSDVHYTKVGIHRTESINVMDIVSGAFVVRKVRGAGSGGGGGGGNWDGGGGFGGGGGGSGATGGIVFICARTWAGTFTIKAIGGNGGDGAVGEDEDAGAGGGGGGGNGGVSVVIYGSKTWTGSYNLAGGAAGNGGAGSGERAGVAGTAGATGEYYEIQIGTLL